MKKNKYEEATNKLRIQREKAQKENIAIITAEQKAKINFLAFEAWWEQTKIDESEMTPLIKLAFREICSRAWVNGYEMANTSKVNL